MYEKILSFKGQWRTYQQRILNCFDKYKSDGKIHIVAAPGSGKTTLGIELIIRFDQPVLVFVPTITIREQWIERIKEAFLEDHLDSQDYLSTDLKDLKLINVVTYQSLHSAIMQYKGVIVEGDDDLQHKEVVDYNDYNILQAIEEANIQTICLDECHHLRSEWWKSLETFKKESHIRYTISLTATPPYDSDPQMWKRYIDMCGEIDEEITVPELVKEGSLCPHQDYVYFNYPTREEEKEVKKYKQKVADVMEWLMNDNEFQKVIQSHPCLYRQVDDDILLKNPAYLSSILIYLNAKQLSYPLYYQSLLGYKKLEKMSVKWMEILLQGLLYEDKDSFVMSDGYYQYLLKELKSHGLIEKRKVTLQVNQAIEKLLVKSVGKCDSIKTIVFHEYRCMGKNLKLLILTDYIKKEYKKAIGQENRDVHNLGVIPFFEMLRRENKNKGQDLKLGVLCGSVIIIPSSAKRRLLELVPHSDKIGFQSIGALARDEYVEISIIGEHHQIISVVSQLFEEGYMQVLIGTKSLLGEGWDSPCVNTLILASFVGSFMLSNQMRGRAIRTFSKEPLKASHIWHLVCVNPLEEHLEDSEDFVTLQRRMEHFLGLHYEQDTIENGLSRLTAIHYPLSKSHIRRTNQDMLMYSSHRSDLKQRWDQSLAIFDEIEVVEETSVNDQLISMVLFYDAMRTYIVFTVCMLMTFLICLPILPYGLMRYVCTGAYVFIYIIGATVFIQKIFTYKNPLSRLKVFGEGIYHALSQMNLLESMNSKVVVENELTHHFIYLQGGTGHDKALFSKCVVQFFDEIDNQRYILYQPRRKKKMDGYFVVPEVFSKRKEDAMLFAEYIKSFIGKYDVIYTRNANGRKILLHGRIHALANKQSRCIHKKKVKGALE